MKLEVRINLDTADVVYDVQEATGTSCLKATEYVRSVHGATPNEKDEFFSETVDLTNG